MSYEFGVSMFRNFFNPESGSSGSISQNSTILSCIMGFWKILIGY
jgi:hypothetical protein